MELETVVDGKDAQIALGLKSAQALRSVCARFDVKLMKFNSRQLKLTKSQYDLLLSRATERA